MTRNGRRVRLYFVAVLLGTVVQLTACQAAPELDGTAASLSAVVDAVQGFVADFARQVLQAAVL